MSRAIAGWRDLIDRDPANVRWRDVLADGLATRAGVEAQRGDRDAAAATLAEALAIRRRLATDSPDFAPNREKLSALEASTGRGRKGRPPPS